MFEKFTERSIKAIMLAQDEARRMGHNFVGTEQILLGLIGEKTGLAARLLKSMGVHLENARLEVEKIIGRGSGFIAEEIPFTPRAKRILNFSLEESRLLGDNSVKTEHVLLGLIREKDGVGARALIALGTNLAAIRTKVIWVLNKNTSQVQNLDTSRHEIKDSSQAQNSDTSEPKISERFTEKAIKAILLAQEEARLMGHNFVGTEQILLGLIGEATGIAAKMLKSKGVRLRNARLEVEKIIGRGSGFVAKEIPFTARAKRILELTLEEARQLGHNYIGTEHLLLGLIREGEGVALTVLDNLGVNSEAIVSQVIRILDENNNPPIPKLATNPKPIINKPREIRLIDLIDTLADCFYKENDANHLLLRISFPMRYKPNFNKFNTSFEFWQVICVKIESGILRECGSSHAAFKLTIEQARTIYPGNDKLKEIYQKYFS